MPAFACIVVVFGLIKKVPVFDVFISGAKEGVKLLYNIAPTIMGLVFAVDLLQSSRIFRISERNCSARTPPPRFGKRFNRTPHSPLQNLRSRQLCGQNSIRTRRFKRNNLLRNRNVLWLYPSQKNSPHPLCRHNR